MSPAPAGRELVAEARQLATAAHKGQVDKAGEPYIGHPARVAAGARVRAAGSASSRSAAGARLLAEGSASTAGTDVVDIVEATGWLHDVVEDTEVTLDQLAKRFPLPIVAAVDALTRRPDEPVEDYYARIASDPIALVVKQSDVADNSDPARLALLDAATRTRLQAKYAATLATLARINNS